MSCIRERLNLYYCEVGVPEASEEGITPCNLIAVARWKWENGEWLYVCEIHDEELCERHYDDCIDREYTEDEE